jgi:hypothetical protein
VLTAVAVAACTNVNDDADLSSVFDATPPADDAADAVISVVGAVADSSVLRELFSPSQWWSSVF